LSMMKMNKEGEEGSVNMAKGEYGYVNDKG
jgi:hypothetical protein